MTRLSELFVGMTTRYTGAAGTKSQVTLIINEKGIDKLEYNFPNTVQSDMKKGMANVYKISSPDIYDIDFDKLTDSSVRIGIRGDDMWRPEHLFLWGKNGKLIIPIAMETNITKRLSTDVREGKLSIPIRLVKPGADNMKIKRLLVMMTTSFIPSADTKSKIELRITNDKQVKVLSYEFPETLQKSQEKGEANMYLISLNKFFKKEDLISGSIDLRIKGHDAWLPKSFFLFGLDEETGRSENLVPLVHIEKWNFGWLSTDVSEGKQTIALPLARFIFEEV